MKKNTKELSYKDRAKSYINYIFKGDDLLSHVLFFVVLFILFKFILLPSIGFVLNTSYPMTAIVSESMEQDLNDRVCGKVPSSSATYWQTCGTLYEQEFNISGEEFELFPYSDGMNRGDVIIVYGKDPSNINVGDIVLFKGQDKVQLPNGEEESRFYLDYGPIIHRVVEKKFENDTYYFTTKGDNNPQVISYEKNIPQEDIIGVAVIRVPYLGLINYWAYQYVIGPIRGQI
ncbi:MAG: signal peptidase I [Candidatus Nanoarchaeia archaeon]